MAIRFSLLFLLVYFFSAVGVFALAPDKLEYPYNKDNFGVYVGVNGGFSVSNTFGLGSQTDFIGLYTPTNLFSGGAIAAQLGMRIYDFRIEGEYLYYYQWYSVMNNPEYATNSDAASTYPDKGQEAMKGAFAINAYYDMRFISETLYPYIGFGLGRGDMHYVFVDEFMQANGAGEQYSGVAENNRFFQFMVGFQYDLKVVKSSFNVEYRLTSMHDMDIYPGNDGFTDVATDPDNPNCPGGGGEAQNECPVNPNYPNGPRETHSKRVSPIYHSIMFGIKYYLN